jgi:hypothetical protein
MHQRNSDKRQFVMPEKFDFGIEENETHADQPQTQTGCQHRWRHREKEHQTLADEGKTIWICDECGEITNTYSWQQP